ncbi:AraC family transcriptional regulator [Barnesiella intestinihominis]|uniref:AraC family transcriptional regulator n=1 Tax=Barnesiella intestinihominis TaxID=487174 RepID=UPI003FD864B5
MKNIQHEITPINEDDLFIILNHPKADFDYPIHFHSDFELNLVLWDFGRRIVGDSIESFEEVDLVLTGPNVPHKWEGNNVESNHVITIQFHEQLLTFPILQKRMFSSIKDMLEKSKRGIQFTENKNSDIVKRIIAMTQMTGFNVCLEFFALLYDLSTNPRQRILASGTFDNDSILRDSKSRRIAKINEYINNNYMNPIKLCDIAQLVSMSDSALSHFFKKRTNRNIVDYINDIRISNATKMLFETTNSISEIAFLCGFNNISNFNRIFKKNKGKTPSEYRESIQKIMIKY